MQREAYEQMMYEQEVQRMEQEERALIDRLKATKSLEESAKRDLDMAYTDPNVLTKQPIAASRKSGTKQKF